MEITPMEKAQEIWDSCNRYFKPAFSESGKILNHELQRSLATLITEHIIGALHDEGRTRPQFWYNVQEELNKFQL